MKKNKYLVSHTNYEIVDKNDEVIDIEVASRFFKVETLLKSCDIGLSTVMIKKNFTRIHYFETLKQKEDFVLWLKNT